MHQYTPLQVTVPANTPPTAAVSKTWTLYPGVVRGFRINIPRGHSLATGIRLVYKQTPIIPFDLTQYLVGDGDTFEVPYDDEVMTTGLVAQAFNTDVWPHTFYLWADVDPYGQVNFPPGLDERHRQQAEAVNLGAVRALASTGAVAA